MTRPTIGFYFLGVLQEIQRIQRGRDEIRVWTRYTPDDRLTLGQIDQMRIVAQGGDVYPFSELASYTIKRGITKISHVDRRREIKIEASPTIVEADLPPILSQISHINFSSMLKFYLYIYKSHHILASSFLHVYNHLEKGMVIYRLLQDPHF